MEMLEDDQPPPEIWLNDEALENHFAWLKEKRASAGTDIEAPDRDSWSTNELTKGLR